jgi:uncharacterized protein YjcR
VARRLYEDKTLPVREVARKAGIDPKTLYVYAKREGWSARSDRMVPSDIRPLEWAGRRCTGLALCPERKALVGRAWAAAHQQMDEIENRLKLMGSGKSTSDLALWREARSVATLVRTLKDLSRIDDEETARIADRLKAEKESKDGSSSDPTPLETEMRERLARRLEGLRKGRQVERSAGADG